jgi:hypothetical protein
MKYTTLEDANAKIEQLLHDIDSLNEYIKALENGCTPIYCPTCGSCGETGCCYPDKCQAVRCLYGETNIQDYRELLEENEKYRLRAARWKRACKRNNALLSIRKILIDTHK